MWRFESVHGFASVGNLYQKMHFAGSNLSKAPKWCVEQSSARNAFAKFRSLASKSRHRRVWNQGEALYGIATKSRMESSRSDVWNQSEGGETWIRAKARCHAVAKRRITCNARGALITYQSFGLDRKKHACACFFLWRVSDLDAKPCVADLDARWFCRGYSNPLAMMGFKRFRGLPDF